MPAPRLFRVTIEVTELEAAAAFYQALLGDAGSRRPGARHYFACGGVIVALLDVSRGDSAPGAKSLYFATGELDAVHARALGLGALAAYDVHGAPAGDVTVRPWGERSFYAVDPWGNDLCFVDEATLYT